jgi:outer membrane protein
MLRAQQVSAPPLTLTLASAKAYALRNNPRIKSADSSTAAAGSVVKEVRSARLPTVTGLATGVDAQHSTILAAGTLQTSSLYSRFASGITVNQLVTDFGRTSNLTKSAQLRREAQGNNGQAVREDVLLQVAQSYFQALGGNAAVRAAQAAVTNRDVTLRQIRALQESSLRSTLDVRFAEVALSQAQLDLVQAENIAAEAQSNLAAALGLNQTGAFTLADEPDPPVLDPSAASSVQEAMRKRPDLSALTSTRDAEHRYATAEARLKLPTVSALATAGLVPAGDPRLPDSYSAAGLNITIPILNGGLFSARRAEAEEHASAADADVSALSNEIARQVRDAWLEANTAARRLDVTARLLAQANEALRLAQTRYDAGLGSIVELSQAQFNQTSADIQNATARYDYLSRRAALDFATGDMQ